MKFYLYLLTNCIKYYGSDHEAANLYLPTIEKMIEKDFNRNKLTRDEYDHIWNVISDLF